MTKLLDQVFLAVILHLSTEIFASVDISSDDSYLAKSILDESSTPGTHFFSEVDDDTQSSVKSYSEISYHPESNSQAEPEHPNEQLSVLDVLLRKRRTEPTTKPDEKVFDIPHADKLPINHDVPEYSVNNNPSNIRDDSQKGLNEGESHVLPIALKLTSLTNQDDNQADKLPIKHDEYLVNSSPSSVQDKKSENDSIEDKPYVHPITFKLTSPTNQDDSVAKDIQLDNDKAKGESIKIIVNPLDRVVS